MQQFGPSPNAASSNWRARFESIDIAGYLRCLDLHLAEVHSATRLSLTAPIMSGGSARLQASASTPLADRHALY